MLRIEAEERARLEEEASNTHEAQMLQPQHSGSSRGWTERISSVGSGGTLSNLMESCSCSSGDVLSSSSAVDLSTIAKRFGILGVTALGGAPAQVALMKTQEWRPQVVVIEIEIEGEGSKGDVIPLVLLLRLVP